MKRWPLLLIALFLLSIAGGVVYLWGSFVAEPIQQQEHMAQSFAQSTGIMVSFLVPGIVLLGFVIWIWALIHLLTCRSIEGADKIVWALVIIFLNVLGGILYFAISPFARETPSEKPGPGGMS